MTNESEAMEVWREARRVSMGDLTNSGRASGRAVAASPSSPSVSPVPASIPDAVADVISGANLTALARMMEPLAELIRMYSETVSEAQAKYQKDCAFLADLIAQSSHIAHAIAAYGANALDAQYTEQWLTATRECALGDGCIGAFCPACRVDIRAQGMSAGTAETAQQAQGEARQPDPEGDAPKGASHD